MLIHRARAIEASRPVNFHPFTYRAILEMSAGVYPWSVLPGKAMDMLRQVAERATDEGARQDITPSHVISMLSAQTGLPENLLTLEARLDPKSVRSAIGRSIIGQPEAISAACDLIARVRAGMTDPKRPLATYLFTGPTGTGKTELAKVIAEYLYGDNSRMIRLDMSELASPDAVARLIGDRWQPEGQLTRAIREQPFSVVLLDEIEKAHPSVLYLLLQLFDEGRLTDAAGNQAAFQNAVIIMTSNLGARATRPIGFGEETRGMLVEVSRAVRDFFPPELFNRIDRVVPFQPLTTYAAEAIATKELAKLLSRRGLVDRNIVAYANQAVKERIVREAFDPRLGARTVKRYLEDKIGGLLTKQITSGPRAHTEVFRIYEAADDFALYVDALGEAEIVGANFHLSDLQGSGNSLASGGTISLSLRREKAALALGRLCSAIDNNRISDAIDVARSSPDIDQLYYFIDELKQRSQSIRSALSRFCSGDRALPRDPDPLQLIADADSLLMGLADMAKIESHSVLVELVRISHSGEVANRPAGLIDWMTMAYAGAGKTGLGAFGCLVENGKTRWRVDTDAEVVAKELANEMRESRPSRVVLAFDSLFARDYFAGEAGCHIWQPTSAEPEIVRVDILAAPTPFSPRAHLEMRERQVREFEEALEGAGADTLPHNLPHNPLALVPAVRTMRFQPALREGDVFPIEFEDFRTGSASTHKVRSFARFMEQMLLCWRGRLPLDSDGVL